ncbi:MAG: DUF3299 domain-containing protein [Gammaproteobacteria bacterium]
MFVNLNQSFAGFVLLGVGMVWQPLAFAQHTQHNQPPDEAGSTVTWEQLGNLNIEAKSTEPLRSEFKVTFPESITSLDGKDVKIKGFMYPLEGKAEQTYFLLAATPPSCPFCLPGGATSMIEVKCKEPVLFTMEPILLKGKFAVLKDDPSGLFYRMTDAKSAPN